ncbi:MAG: hypothetical protein AAF530_01760 [Pseudomonadota bacterium]
MKNLPSSRIAKTAMVVSAGLIMAGCAGQVVSNQGIISDNYDPKTLGYAATRGGVFVDIQGDPFPGAEAQSNQVITESLGRAHFGPKVDFFTEKPADYRSPYRIAMVFGPAKNTNGDRLCRGDDIPLSIEPGETTVLAAFCNGEKRLTSTRAWVTQPSGPTDPAFDNLIRQVGVQLLPPRRQPKDRGPRLRS